MMLSDGLKKVFLAGVGAIAITGEKSKALVDELVKKGELTVEEGKALNEELAGKVGERTSNLAKNIRSAMVDIDRMTKEERDALLEKLMAAKAADEAAAGSEDTAAEEAAAEAPTADETTVEDITVEEDAAEEISDEADEDAAPEADAETKAAE